MQNFFSDAYVSCWSSTRRKQGFTKDLHADRDADV